MDFKRFKKWKDNCWGTVLWAKPISGFYLPLIVISFILGMHFFRIKPEVKILNDSNIIIKTQKMNIDLGGDSLSKTPLKTKVINAVKD